MIAKLIHGVFFDRFFPKNSFARQVSTLATGTAIAQSIPVAISPILTRLYSPEDFGLVGLYISCVSVMSVLVTGRYEQAIPLPAKHEEAAEIVVLTLKLSVLISFLLYLPIYFFGEWVALHLVNKELARYFYLLPISTFALSMFNIFQYWCNRRLRYEQMSSNRVQNAGFSAIANIALGLSQLKGGMVIGGAAGQMLSAVLIGRTIWAENKEVFAKTSPKQGISLARSYSNHPKHIAPAQLIGILAQQIPIFIISSLFSLATAGFFSMAYRLVSLPSSLIANAIGDVYRQQISVAYIERREFKNIYLSTLRKTATLAAPPFILLYLVSPWLFELVFGGSWRIAGEYAQILVCASFFQFIFTPVDKGAVVVGATRYVFAWHFFRLCCLLFLFIVANTLVLSVKEILWSLTIINTILYLLDGFVEWHYATSK